MMVKRRELLLAWCTTACFCRSFSTAFTNTNRLLPASASPFSARPFPPFGRLLSLAAPIDGDGEYARTQAIRGAFDRLEHLHETSSAFFQKLDKLVVVRASSIDGGAAGRGLFARKNIKAGSIISFYPVHGIGGDDGSACVGASDDIQKYFDREGADTSYVQYLVGSRPFMSQDSKELFGGEAMYIDVDPTVQVDPGWLSHFINDGATVDLPGDEACMLDYYTRSRAAKNCVHVPFGPCPVIATVA